MTILYFADSGTLYAQEGGRCAKLVTRAIAEPGRAGFAEVWEAVPVPPAGLFAPPEAPVVADAPETAYGTPVIGSVGIWSCACPDFGLNSANAPDCTACKMLNPALRPTPA